MIFEKEGIDSMNQKIAKNAAVPLIAALAGNVVAEVVPLQELPPLPPPAILVRDLRSNEKPVAVETTAETTGDNGLVRRVLTRFTFTNPNARVMQGEFEFPIPDGATVCAYALEIDGVMVPGSICEKEKARVAFETEVKKGIDPGLVEQIKGNVWRTRIFPLTPGTPRKAQVEYVVPVAEGIAATVCEKDGDDVFIGERGLAAESAPDPVAAFDSGIILWDASASAESAAARWRATAAALPDGGKWRLVAFRNVPEDLGTFGKAELLAKLDAIVYDGGTDIAKAVAFAGREKTLLFSDELDTLATAVPHYDDMKNIVVASRPQVPQRNVRIRRMAAGEKIPDGVEVKNGRLLATQWAAERIHDLSAQAQARKDEFLALGRRYGVASSVTSLIVLETLDQYLTHKIEPHPALPFHDDWVKQRAAQDDQIALAEADVEHRRNLLSLWKQRVEWWNDPIPKKATPKSGLFDRLFSSSHGENHSAAAAGGAARLRRAPDMEEAGALVDGGPTEAGMPAPAMAEDADFAVAKSAAVGILPPSQAGGGGATISITPWKADAAYVKEIENAQDKYQAYLKEKKANGTSPAFYMDAAGVFFRAGDKVIGERILSNMAEFKLEDAAIWRSMGWRLREADCFEAAILCFRHALLLRGEEGQSRRDLALVLSEYGKLTRNVDAISEAMSLLKDAAFTNWARRSSRRSNDWQVSIVALEELNALLAWCAATGLDVKAPELESAYRRDMPLKIRIVLSWDADETDIDLHVLEPDGEEAFYGHRRTSSGGFVSEDVTTGYGPEEYLRKQGSGKFKILTNYFASHQTALTGPATVTATVYTDWATAAEKRQVITLRLDKPKEKVLIGEVTVAE